MKVPLCVLVTSLMMTQMAFAGDGEVRSHQKISDTAGNFSGVLDDVDRFGISVASIGDHDGDGVPDIVVGAQQDDDGGSDHGAVWLLFLNADGTVNHHQKISDTEGGLFGLLLDGDRFGVGVTSMGDVDGDGIGDIAVGAHGDDDGGFATGAAYVLFLRRNGTVRGGMKISRSEGQFTGAIESGDLFGSAVAGIGDLDGDGVNDLAVGALWDDDGGKDTGAIWVLFLRANGRVKAHQKISDTQGGFTAVLSDEDLFGRSVASLGDINNDGYTEIAVGAPLDDDGGPGFGAVWILSLNGDGTVRSYQKISSTEGGFTGVLDNRDQFGIDVTSLGDVDCDGVTDLAVGANTDDDGGPDHGAVWLLFLNTDGTVKSHQKISDTAGNFDGVLEDIESFAISVAGHDDMNGDGVPELIVGATGDNDGGIGRGAAWLLFLDGCTVPVLLQDYASYWMDGHIEIRWQLSGETTGEIAFDTYRRVGDAGSFTRLDATYVRHATGEFTLEDHAVEPGRTYIHRVVVTENGEPVTSFETTTRTPTPTFKLVRNRPNPFRSSTRIEFELDSQANVMLSVYDVSGRLVRTLVDRPYSQGSHFVSWDGRDDLGNRVTSGIYFYRLRSDGVTLTRKSLLLR